MATPTWSAARSGLLGDTGALNASAQLNQLLGTHGVQLIYQGKQVVAPNGSGAGTIVSNKALAQFDVAQPFTMSGTTIGRVTVPVIPVGSGADMVVSLYTNNAGVPGTLLNQARVPANWMTQLAYANAQGSVGSAIVFNASGNQLALAQFNAWRMGQQVSGTWPYPSVNASGGAASPASCYFGNYIILVGGVDNAHNVVNSVFTAFYDTVGNLSPSVPTSSTPTVTDGSGKVVVVTDATSGTPTVVLVGGGTTYLGTPNANVFTAQFNATNGTLSTWTVQTVLPTIIQNQGMATYNGYVYVIAGSNGSNTLSSVYYAQVQNGQITSWTAGPSLPQSLMLPYCAVSNGFLYVTSGTNITFTTNYTTTYVSKLNANGSLGPWMLGPSFSSGSANLDQTIYGGSLGIITNATGQNAMLVTPDGGDLFWTNENSGGGAFTGFIQTDPVSLRVYGAGTFGTYTTYGMKLLPSISVPLPTTGLSNGTLYHLVVQSPSNDLNNYLNWAWDFFSALPGNPSFLSRARNSTTWNTNTGLAMPITVYDQSVLGNVWHTWEDSGAKITTLAWGTTPNQPLLGLLEATSQPGPPLNMNYTFTQGVAPWHPTGGTFVQSNAQTHGNLPFSGLLTPSGSASLSYAESELVAVRPGDKYVFTAWYYSPTGYSNVAISVNWFDVNKNYISTTSGSATSIGAGTWTQFQTTATNNVTNAVYADMVCIEGGTPPNTALLYVSAATVQDTSGPQVSSVLGYDYEATWPSPNMWPPVGVNLLA